MRLLLIWLLCPWVVQAGNLQVGAVEAVGSDGVRFEISWEHAWHYPDTTAPGNSDAVWVFLKGRSLQTGEWEPIILSGADNGGGSILQTRIATSGLGVMISRNDFGEGMVDREVIQCYIDADLAAYASVAVHGIEMVYVPEGPFYAGDTASTNTLLTSGGRSPYYIGSEAAISSGTAPGQLWSKQDFPPAGNVPSAFPKGFRGFYSMKYEISQEQYASFLNQQTAAQAQVNLPSTLAEAPCFAGDHIDGERHFIVRQSNTHGCDANGNGILNETDDGGNTACNFLTWAQFTAYLDWAGLRPMTELEFEKACRGPLEPVPLEYAWGTPFVVNTLQPTELASDTEHCLDPVPTGHGLANYGYCRPSGPLRCGFAAYGASDRVSSGASYYGLMEMSGNLWELCVVLTSGGLAFSGAHGDGRLSPQGRENAWNWATGAGGFRGGGWNSGILAEFRDLAVSDRFFVYLDGNDFARGTAGGRGVISESQLE